MYKRWWLIGILVLVLAACRWLSPSYWLQQGMQQIPTLEAAATALPSAVAGAQPTVPPTATAAGETVSPENAWEAPDVHSFRLRYALTVESPLFSQGQPVTAEGLSMEVRRTPELRLHGVGEGLWKETFEEFYQIGSTFYIKTGGSWAVATSDVFQGNFDYLDYTQMLVPFSTDWTMVGKETINGIATRHYRQEVTALAPGSAEMVLANEALSALGVTTQDVQIDRWVAEAYLAETGNWPVRQALQWQGKVTVNDQQAPLTVTASVEISDVNADFAIELPAEAAALTGGGAGAAPIPLPEGAQLSGATGGAGGQMTIYHVPGTTPDNMVAFWEDHPDVNIANQMGSAAGMMITLTYQGKTFSVVLAPEGNGTQIVIQGP